MEAIYFNLSGKTAFFKKPDVNVYAYFTYNNIHKIALLGLLGAVAGFAGYNNQGKDERYPEFYEKLKLLKTSIIPKGDRGYFSKKIQVFNNSVGYASKEEGGNLIVREQWIENPQWDIYILDDGSIDNSAFEILKNNLLEQKCAYMPYLGKNDHPAKISNAKIVELEPCTEVEYIDSLFPEDSAVLDDNPYDDNESVYLYREMLPYDLDDIYNSYLFKSMVFTNLYIESVKNLNMFYMIDKKNICFI